MPDQSLDDVLHKIAMHARNAYCRLRMRAQCIDQFAPGPKYYKSWYKVAEICMINSLDPYEFMEVQFFAIKPWPDINVACSTSALDRFLRYRGNYVSNIAVEVSTQLKVFERLMSIDEYTAEEVLCDDNNRFDVLFTYLAAIASGLDDMASKCSDAAFLQYLSSTHYDAVYKDAIPEEFRKRREELRQELGGMPCGST